MLHTFFISSQVHCCAEVGLLTTAQVMNGSDSVRIITVNCYSTPHQSDRGGRWALLGGRGQRIDCHPIAGRVSSWCAHV